MSVKNILPANAMAFFLIVLFQPLTLRAELVDHIVAAVNNEVITWSELQQTTEINQALGGGRAERRKVEAETLEGLINRRLLLQEAHRLRFAEVSPQDIQGEVEKFKKRFGSERAFSDFIAGLGITTAQLERMLGERLQVEKFVEKKVTLFVRVGREEAQEYFDRHPGEFKGKRFQEVYKSIVARLTEQKTDQALADYLSELRGKAGIRMNSVREQSSLTMTDGGFLPSSSRNGADTVRARLSLTE